MKIVHSNEMPEMENAHHVSVRPLHSSEHVQVSMITLQPGEALHRHVTPVDAFFYILEGSGMVEVGGEEQPVSQDMLIDSPARIPHLVRNDSPAVLRFLVVKAPRQAEEGRLL